MNHVGSSKQWKWIVAAFALIGGCSACVWLIFFSQLFRIEYINVSATGIDPGYVRTLIFKFMDTHAGVFSAQNLLFFNTSRASENLAEVVHIDTISFDKKFPKTLHVTITGKPFRAVVYHQGRFYDLSSQGKILQEIDGSALGPYPVFLTQYTNAGGFLRIPKKQASKEALSFPLIMFDTSGTSTLSDFQIDSTTLSAILDSAKTFTRDTGPIFFFRVGSEQGNFTAVTFEGWSLRLSSGENIRDQWQRLQTFLTSIDKTARKSLDYIDLRFGNRVYYKPKMQ